jgi:hypothetical protein
MRILTFPRSTDGAPSILPSIGSDDWKVNNKLTLNLGLRYDMPIPVTEQRKPHVLCGPNPRRTLGRAAFPALTSSKAAGTGRLGGSSPQSIFKKAFGPRVGARLFG